MEIESERADDGRWIAEIPALAGVMAYGATRREAISKAEALALRVIADRIDHGEEIPERKVLVQATFIGRCRAVAGTGGTVPAARS